MHARFVFAVILLATSGAFAAAGQALPRVAFFPLGGNAQETLRTRCWDSLRAKLDRTKQYEVIDGFKMSEVAAEAAEPLAADTAPAILKNLNRFLDADVLVWGDLRNTTKGAVMRVKILDLREGDAARPRMLEKAITTPTDVRFVSEQILETLPGVAIFEHPSEIAVTNDATAEQLWKANPNLVVNGDFAKPGHWSGIYQAEYYDVSISPRPADTDKVVIWKMPDGAQVLSMNLSRYCAENNGLACLSQAIEIEPDTRYRISFRYRSEAPVLHVFVKGYTEDKDIAGRKTQREIYRRQLPVTGATGGEWVTIIDDLNPQHIVFPVQSLKIDLYAYLHPGRVEFDDVVLKAVGKPTRQATDEAIDKPIERGRRTP